MNSSLKDKITTSQAVVIIINYILATGILTLPRASVEKVKTPDVWISVFLGGIVAMIAGVIIVKLSQQYPDKTFYQYNQDILGKWLGWFLSTCVIVYFFTISAFEVRIMAEVTSLFLLEGTPTWAIILPFLWVGLYLISGGINTIARLFEIIFPITFVIFLLVAFLSLGIFEIDNLRPVLGLGVVPMLKGIKTATLAFLGPEIMLLLVAFMYPSDRSKAVKVVLVGITIPLLFYVITVVMVIGALSIEGVMTRTWPTIELMRSFEIPGLIFERFESFLLVIWIMQIFATFTITYYAAALGLAQLFKKSMHPFLYGLLPIIYIIAMTPKNINDLFTFGDKIGHAALILFGAVPIILLLISKMERKESMKRKHRYSQYLLVMTVPFFLTGCWSSKEIEDLGLIVGTSLDLETGDVSSEEQQDARYANRELLTITNQFVTSETTVSGTREGALPEKAYKNVSETGDAVLPTLRNMLLKVDKHSFAEHSKVIIIGEELASTVNLQQTLDFFLRELEIRPSGLLLIAQNQASQALETNEPTKIPAFQLVEMMEGHERTTKILPPMTVAKLEGKLYSDSSFLLQNVIAENGEVKFAGAAIIEGKTKKLRGFVNESDIEGIAWMSGDAKGGLVKGFDEESGAPIVYEIISTKSKIIPHVKGDQISFTIKIQSEGRIAEHWVLSDKAFDNQFLKKAEKVFEKEIERLVMKVLEKTQHEFQTDVSGFGNKLRINYPRVWQKIKKEWDQTFSEVPITCEVNVSIKDYGTSGD